MLRGASGQSSAGVVQSVTEAVRGFVGNALPFDDITMLAIRRLDPAQLAVVLLVAAGYRAVGRRDRGRHDSAREHDDGYGDDEYRDPSLGLKHKGMFLSLTGRSGDSGG